jgi:hypothetical protein
MIQDPTLRLHTTHAEQRTHRARAAEHNLGRSLQQTTSPSNRPATTRSRRAVRLPRLRLANPLRRWSAASSG